MRPIARQISPKQREIYDCIVNTTAKLGYPPSVREICAAVGLKSTSTVHTHLKKLQLLGYIEKSDHKTRAIKVDIPAADKVPILGTVAAGEPILAVEQADEFLGLDLGGEAGEHFALYVAGDSMVNAGIVDDDLVIIRWQETANPGDIVVALLEEEATLKRLWIENGHVWLMPENDAYEPIDGSGCRILGKMVALVRWY
ncbi:LexA repressor [Clostridia bacterium]|nr:LexA repressor [Clostridia bacterium]